MKQYVAKTTSRRRKGLKAVALAGAAGAVALGAAAQTSASAAPYSAVWRVAGLPAGWTFTCASPGGCTAGGVGPVGANRQIVNKQIDQWDRTVTVFCVSATPDEWRFKVNVKDVNWSGDWFVYAGSVHHGSGDGPEENRANYPNC